MGVGDEDGGRGGVEGGGGKREVIAFCSVFHVSSLTSQLYHDIAHSSLRAQMLPPQPSAVSACREDSMISLGCGLDLSLSLPPIPTPLTPWHIRTQTHLQEGSSSSSAGAGC